MTLLARGGVSIGDAPEIDSDDEYEAERDRNAKDSGIVGNLQEQIRTEFDKGMLELRLQLVRMRTEYLNNINTQAMLLGSIAVAMLSQSELISFDDTIETWWSLIFCAVGPDGKFTAEAPPYAGQWVKDADKAIIRAPTRHQTPAVAARGTGPHRRVLGTTQHLMLCGAGH